MGKKMTFALAFCNRGFMPGELIYGARQDMIRAVSDAGSVSYTHLDVYKRQVYYSVTCYDEYAMRTTCLGRQ